MLDKLEQQITSHSRLVCFPFFKNVYEISNDLTDCPTRIASHSNDGAMTVPDSISVMPSPWVF